MSKIQLRACSTVVLFSVLLAGAPALAEPAPADSALATELFNSGKDLMIQGDYAAACPKLQESARLDPKVGTLARLAECEEKQGHFVVARGFWQQAFNVAKSMSDSRADHVSDELARLDKIVPKILVVASAADPDVEVTVDDRILGAGALGVPLPVEPGAHTVSARARMKRPWRLNVVTSGNGATTTVNIPELMAEEVAKPAVASGPDVPAEGSSSSSQRTAGLITGGFGIAGLIAGTAFGLAASAKNDEVGTGCSGNVCDDAGAETRSTARTLGNVATAAFVLGGVGVAGGAALFFGAPKEGEKPGALSQRNVSFVIGGIGVVGLAIGTVYALGAMSKNDDSSPLCPEGRCSSEGASLRRDAREAGDNATIAFVAGTACLVGAATLYFTSGSKTSNRISVGMGRTGFGVQGTW